MIAKSGSKQECVTWFSKHPPQTATGAIAYAGALQDRRKIGSVVRTAWTTLPFSASEEAQFLKTFGHHLAETHHHSRLRFCLWKEHIDQAKRLLPRVSAALKNITHVCMAFIEGKPHASQKLQALPPHLQQDEKLLHVVTECHKKQKNIPEAVRILTEVCPSEAAEHWWKVRNYMARELIALRDYGRAYQVLAKHNLTPGGEDFANAEWLMGWLSLRFLNHPQEALCHFEKVAANVKGAISKARASYWLGRTFEQMSDMTRAAEAYKEGALYKTTYYGQLSAAKLQEKAHPSLRAVKANPQAKAKFKQKDLVKAAYILKNKGKTADDTLRKFLMHIGEKAKTQTEKELAVQLAHELSTPSVVWVARKVGHANPVELKIAFPTCPLPQKASISVEEAFVMAVAYQESRFDPAVVSEANAMGLLQLVGPTAAREAKRLKVPHSERKLFDPKHNLLLGSSHLSSLLKDFDGSYILVAIAYNAGPHVASRWITELGDPRDPGVDVIDWIELIPYAETRNYVQRVLETTTTYRCLKGSPRHTLIDDLQRRG